jgi:K+/H+ antiporter YhaU regulatory subunit KhtT
MILKKLRDLGGRLFFQDEKGNSFNITGSKDPRNLPDQYKATFAQLQAQNIDPYDIDVLCNQLEGWYDRDDSSCGNGQLSNRNLEYIGYSDILVKLKEDPRFPEHKLAKLFPCDATGQIIESPRAHATPWFLAARQGPKEVNGKTDIYWKNHEIGTYEELERLARFVPEFYLKALDSSGHTPFEGYSLGVDSVRILEFRKNMKDHEWYEKKHREDYESKMKRSSENIKRLNKSKEEVEKELFKTLEKTIIKKPGILKTNSQLVELIEEYLKKEVSAEEFENSLRSFSLCTGEYLTELPTPTIGRAASIDRKLKKEKEIEKEEMGDASSPWKDIERKQKWAKEKEEKINKILERHPHLKDYNFHTSLKKEAEKSLGKDNEEFKELRKLLNSYSQALGYIQGIKECDQRGICDFLDFEVTAAKKPTGKIYNSHLEYWNEHIAPSLDKGIIGTDELINYAIAIRQLAFDKDIRDPNILQTALSLENTVMMRYASSGTGIGLEKISPELIENGADYGITPDSEVRMTSPRLALRGEENISEIIDNLKTYMSKEISLKKQFIKGKNAGELQILIENN